MRGSLTSWSPKRRGYWSRSTSGRREEIATAMAMLLDHKHFAIRDLDVVAAALEKFRKSKGISFSDLLILETARKNGHVPLGSFDRGLAKLALSACNTDPAPNSPTKRAVSRKIKQERSLTLTAVVLTMARICLVTKPSAASLAERKTYRKHLIPLILCSQSIDPVLDNLSHDGRCIVLANKLLSSFGTLPSKIRRLQHNPHRRRSRSQIGFSPYLTL